MLMSRNSRWKMKAISGFLGIILAFGLSSAAKAVGSWTTLTNPAPEQIGLMLMLTDGRVIAQGYSNNTWYALTADATGSYANGT